MDERYGCDFYKDPYSNIIDAYHYFKNSGCTLDIDSIIKMCKKENISEEDTIRLIEQFHY